MADQADHSEFLAELSLSDSNVPEDARVDATDQTGHASHDQTGHASHDPTVRDSVYQIVRDSVDQAVRDSVHQAVRDSVDQTVRDSVNQAVRDSINQVVRDSVDQAVRDSFNQAVRDSDADFDDSDGQSEPPSDDESGPTDQSQNVNTQGTQRAPGFQKCGKPRCKTCSIALLINTVNGVNGEEHAINGHFTCRVIGVVYVVRCIKCDKQYVGRSTELFRTTIEGHYRGRTDQLVSLHFNTANCGLDAMRCFVVEKVVRSDQLNAKRDEWKRKLNTKEPNGLNK